MSRISAQSTLTTTQFNERRLELAQFLAQQRGLTWTGLAIKERDLYMDAAEGALRAIEGGLVSLVAKQALLDADDASATVAEAAHEWLDAIRRKDVIQAETNRAILFHALALFSAKPEDDGTPVRRVVASAYAFREAYRDRFATTSEVCAIRNSMIEALDALFPPQGDAAA